jgi:phthalate 4,5-dioxygenase oxygenase subunit
MDDTHTLVITINRASMGRMRTRLASGEPIPGLGTDVNSGIEYLPPTTDWFGRWRLANNAENDYRIDRAAQRHGGVFSGIYGLTVQDAAIAGTMGPITDRTLETLTPSDAMIARMRHKLLRFAEAFAADKSTRLPGVDDAGLYRGHRAGNFVAPSAMPFREAYADMMRRHANAAPRWAAE